MSNLVEQEAISPQSEDLALRAKDVILPLHDGDLGRLLGYLQIVGSVTTAAIFVIWLGRGGLPLFSALALIVAVAGCVAWLTFAARQVRKVGRSLRCAPGALLVQRDEAVEQTIPYEQIHAVKFQPTSQSEWLTIVLRGGEVRTFPFYQVAMKRSKAEETLLRAIGPLLKWDTVLVRSPRPQGVLEGLEYDCFYNVPTVPMDAGVLYKYRYPDEMKKRLGSESKEIWDSVWGFGLFYSILFFSITLRLLFTVFSLWAFSSTLMSRRVFRRSLGDRFMLEGDGLRVFRGNKSWVVKQETPTSFYLDKIGYCDGGAKRLGRGRQVYYFDPRFIEPDV